jgi:hypothetical protein
MIVGADVEEFETPCFGMKTDGQPNVWLRWKLLPILSNAYYNENNLFRVSLHHIDLELYKPL